VIDRPALIAWRSKAPWPNPVQIEQDLLLSRLMIEIARDEVLGPELTMRGGTCLHKLHLPTPLRYSEDLDYVRRTHTGVKPYTQALGALADRLGLTVSSRQRSGQMVHVYLAAKLSSTRFLRDLDALVTNTPAGYDPDTAADLVMRELGSRLRNAPPADEIALLSS